MVVLFPIRNIGPVLVDVVVEESVVAEMEVPEHPVERGAKISDHAYRKPTLLTMTCISEMVLPAWQALYALMQAAEPFDVLTGFDLFPTMVIQKLEPRRDVETGRVLAFSATLKEVIIVATAETGGGSGNQGKGGDERGQSKTERGQVQARPVDLTSGRGEQVLASLQTR